MLAQSIHYAKRGVFTALTLFLAIYGFSILLTYTPNDPSWSHISSNIDSISNIGGAVGAWIADLLYVFLGGTAWLLLLLFIFESIMIWRDHNLPMVGLRVIAYFFLLLAVSAQLSFLELSINSAWQTDLQSIAANGVPRFGGIVGYEVLMALVQSLTKYGALAFLIVFTLIAATYAFDIRWYEGYLSLVHNKKTDSTRKQTITKNINNKQNIGFHAADKNELDGLNTQDESTEQDIAASVDAQEFDVYIHDDDNEEVVADQDAHSNKQLQLKLPKQKELTAKQQLRNPSLNATSASIHQSNAIENVKQEAAFDNIFNEFLVDSGLSETLLQVQREEAERAAREADQALKGKKSTSRIHSDINTNVASDLQVDKDASDISKASKLEGSQSMDDQQVIDDVLDEQARQLQINGNEHIDIDDTCHNATERQNTDLVAKVPNQVDIIEDDIASGDLDTSYTNNALNEQEVSDNVSIDMTPTNTPPENPTQFKKPSNNKDFEIKHINQPPENQASRADKEVTKRVEPDIRFAVAEGEQSNYIEEMVPESNDSETGDMDMQELQKVSSDSAAMPDIHDDAAFKSKSRAMQTAKYRESLTPIPEISILDKPDPERKPSYTSTELEQLSELLEIKLQDFNVKATVINAIPGPVVTRFEVELAAGVKASKVTGISRDLARSLSMASLRVVEVIPGKPYIGIEVPNKKREMVRLIELLSTQKYKDPKAQISMAMGKNIGGKPIITDLARAPHMLVAGTTGSGKSVLVNSMLLSMLLKYTPSELRLILIDPKQLELANYNGIPHLLTPVVTDMNEAASSLSWCVAEMERRYQLMSLLKVRKLGEFNKKVIAAEKSGRPMIDPLWRPNDSVSISEAPKLKTLPMIVIVADEFADMIMQVGKQAEELITRLAQKSRAAGIHLMLATQRPSVDVITGLIKANIPVRAALRVNSKVDSRTILDAGGAEDMLGNGDMLFLGPGQIEPERVHGAYVSDEEVNRVCDAWRERGAPDYIDNMASNFELSSPSSGGNNSGEDDELYDQAVAFIMETRKVSASSIQRKFSIGYNRAARIVDSMEEAGLVSSMGKSGKRELLM